jgi:hypothetical protein
MTICYLVFRADSLTYTISKALTYAGYDVLVWVVDPEHGRRAMDKIQKRLVATPGVRVLSGQEGELPTRLDRLVVQVFPRPFESVQDFDLLAKRASRIAVISAGDRSKPWRAAMELQWMELRRFMPHAGKIDRVLYKDGFYRFDLHGLLKPRSVTGFDVHSQFLDSQAAFRTIHNCDWKPESSRAILASFLGSQDPHPRKRILDSVRDLFEPSHEAEAIRGQKVMYWHEYSDASPGGIDPIGFLDVLSRSDFALCPRGYSLVTHRPMEALLRGSIPVLSASELDLYDIGLRDGVNCIAVPRGGWRQTVQSLGQIGESKVVGMRRAIASMLGDRLDYEASSARMRMRFGLPVAPAMGAPSSGCMTRVA